MLFGYCIRAGAEPPPPPGLVGVGNAPVLHLSEAGLGLWYSPGTVVRPTVDALRAHERVVRAALRSATPLPIRYGAATFPEESAAREALRARRDEFLEALRRVAGRVEMGVRVRWSRPAAGEGSTAPGSDITSGREYLMARRRELEARAALRRQAERALDEVADRFADLGLPTVRSIAPDPTGPGALAHLVQTEELDRYRERVAQARTALHEYTLALSGPWAPYSFV